MSDTLIIFKSVAFKRRLKSFSPSYEVCNVISQHNNKMNWNKAELKRVHTKYNKIAQLEY